MVCRCVPHLRPEIHVISRCSILVNVLKCPAKSNHEPPVCSFRVSVCIQFIFRLGLGLLFVSSRILVRGTLYDFYCLYFSPEVMVKFMRWAMQYFVTLTENGNRMHLIMCISGHISSSEKCQIALYV